MPIGLFQEKLYKFLLLCREGLFENVFFFEGGKTCQILVETCESAISLLAVFFPEPQTEIALCGRSEREFTILPLFRRESLTRRAICTKKSRSFIRPPAIIAIRDSRKKSLLSGG